MTPGRRTALATVLVSGSALAVLPAQAVVPAATEDQLVLSVDRSTWAPDVTTSLLDPNLVWVPGDVVTGTLYARNVSGENASAVATVHLGDAPDGAGDPLVDELNVRIRMGAAPWTDGTTSVITDLPPGEEIPIGMEVELDPAAASTSQQQTARIDVAVTLSAVGQSEGDRRHSQPGVDVRLHPVQGRAMKTVSARELKQDPHTVIQHVLETGTSTRSRAMADRPGCESSRTAGLLAAGSGEPPLLTSRR
ncbi:hypothetical protein [Promicromonospora soli]